MLAVFQFSPPQNDHGCSQDRDARRILWCKIPQNTLARGLKLRVSLA